MSIALSIIKTIVFIVTILIIGLMAMELERQLEELQAHATLLEIELSECESASCCE